MGKKGRCGKSVREKEGEGGGECVTAYTPERFPGTGERRRSAGVEAWSCFIRLKAPDYCRLFSSSPPPSLDNPPPFRVRVLTRGCFVSFPGLTILPQDCLARVEQLPRLTEGELASTLARGIFGGGSPYSGVKIVLVLYFVL